MQNKWEDRYAMNIRLVEWLSTPRGSCNSCEFFVGLPLYEQISYD